MPITRRVAIAAPKLFGSALSAAFADAGWLDELDDDVVWCCAGRSFDACAMAMGIAESETAAYVSTTAVI